jgi:hypothetical protein
MKKHQEIICGEKYFMAKSWKKKKEIYLEQK